MLINGKWSRKFNRCKKCKTTEVKHHSFGMCSNCFSKKRYREDKEYHQAFYKDYWEKNKKKLSKRYSKYYKENKERFIINNKAWRKANIKKLRLSGRKYYYKNRERILAYRKQRYEKSHL